MGTIVISQPMFIPWRGLFEQISAADDYVHYDNVQLPQGRSFMNRVQLKSESGVMWLTAPVIRSGMQLIMNVQMDESQSWRTRHLKTIQHLYRRASCFDEVEPLIQKIYDNPTSNLCEFNVYAIESISEFLGLETRFHRSSEHCFGSSKSEALMRIIEKYGAQTYITGHGARNYLDHEYFERQNVNVLYMEYQNIEYRQLFGDYTPYVSVIDLLCNEGMQARNYLKPITKSWKEFINESN